MSGFAKTLGEIYAVDSFRVDPGERFVRMPIKMAGFAVKSGTSGRSGKLLNVLTPHALVPALLHVASCQPQGGGHKAEDSRAQPLGRHAPHQSSAGSGTPSRGCWALTRPVQWRRCRGESARSNSSSPNSRNKSRNSTGGILVGAGWWRRREPPVGRVSAGRGNRSKAARTGKPWRAEETQRCPRALRQLSRLHNPRRLRAGHGGSVLQFVPRRLISGRPWHAEAYEHLGRLCANAVLAIAPRRRSGNLEQRSAP